MTPTFPLSFAQEALWLAARPGEVPPYDQDLEADPPPGAGSRWVLGRCFDIAGHLDLAALRHAVTAVVRRHEALRSVFLHTPDGPVQRIEPPGPVPLRIVDHSDRPDPRAEALAAAQQAVRQPFDLATGPPIRFLVLRLAPCHHLLVVAVHQLVADGRSIEILLRDLGVGYVKALVNGPTTLPEPSIGYVDWAVWQRHRLSGIRRRDLRAWWRAALDDVPRILDLPAQACTEIRPQTRRHRRSVPLPAPTRYAVDALARQQRGTASTVLLAAYGVLLGRYGGADRLLVGIPVANREHPQTAEVVGLFVNTLPVPVDLTGAPTFAELVARTRRATLGVLEHQDLPFEQLVADLAAPRDGARPPLAQVCFTHRGADPSATLTLPSCTVDEVPLDADTGRFELTLLVDESGRDAEVRAEYDADRYAGPFVEGLLAAYVVLLDAAGTAPGTPVSELPLPDRHSHARSVGLDSEPRRPGTDRG
ncbi:condensation domain-containing protein [Plantactinospora endophytica]|uniref:Condensation domain-containing protein n=1 Tax=Plantactinospora endophytica TaxID=673535 RepID=A0ABQ4EBR6_9ACTN|nr:condensation domain-containing protein [Plantactinospora endophytica]GIG92158.1 hypothetical protein Pen02_70940 [Plantactinospora endophytica]